MSKKTQLKNDLIVIGSAILGIPGSYYIGYMILFEMWKASKDLGFAANLFLLGAILCLVAEIGLLYAAILRIKRLFE